MTTVREVYLKFWSEVSAEFIRTGCPVELRPPFSRNWSSASIGRRGYLLAFAVNHRGSEGIVAELDINHREARRLFAALKTSEAAIARELGEKLVWESLQSKCRIAIYKRADFQDSRQREAIKLWFRTMAEALHRVFTKRIDELT